MVAVAERHPRDFGRIIPFPAPHAAIVEFPREPYHTGYQKKLLDRQARVTELARIEAEFTEVGQKPASPPNPRYVSREHHYDTPREVLLKLAFLPIRLKVNPDFKFMGPTAGEELMMMQLQYRIYQFKDFFYRYFDREPIPFYDRALRDNTEYE